VEKSTFVAVVGASGSGKSSVARAGLVPRLRKDQRAIWEIASLVPDHEPLKALAAAIMPFLFPELDPIDRRAKANKLAAAFADGSISLRDMVHDVPNARPAPSGSCWSPISGKRSTRSRTTTLSAGGSWTSCWTPARARCSAWCSPYGATSSAAPSRIARSRTDSRARRSTSAR
jgi:hypothetical protein